MIIPVLIITEVNSESLFSTTAGLEQAIPQFMLSLLCWGTDSRDHVGVSAAAACFQLIARVEHMACVLGDCCELVYSKGHGDDGGVQTDDPRPIGIDS